MTIDWTKPVEFTDGTPIRVVECLADGSAIVAWSDPIGLNASVMLADDEGARNAAPKPRERWIYTPTFETTYDAPPVDAYNYTHVREVLEDK